MELGNVFASVNIDGTIKVGYEDFDDEHEFECTYTFDKENAQKLLEKLNVTNNVEFKNIIIKNFGEHLHDEEFRHFCEDNEIKYNRDTWSF